MKKKRGMNLEYDNETKDEFKKFNSFDNRQDNYAQSSPWANSEEKNYQNNEKNNKKKRSKFNKIVIFIAIIEFITIAYTLRILGLFEFILLVPLGAFILKKLIFRKKRIISSVIIITIYLLITMIGIRLNSFFTSLNNKEIQTVYVVTSKDNDAVNKVTDINDGEVIALAQKGSELGYDLPKKYFAKKHKDFDYKLYDSYVDSVKDFYDGDIKYLIVPSLDDEIINEQFPNFKNDVKIIGKIRKIHKVINPATNIKKQVFSVLVTGTDTRSDMIDQNSRSDAILLLTINPKTREVYEVSVPRDAYIENTGMNNQKDKATHISSNGMQPMLDSIGKLFDTKIDYYIKINFSGFINAIDAVGGIDIDVEGPFCGQNEFDQKGVYCYDAGPTHMNGSQALSYARERHAFSDGDYARARHQSDVIQSFLKALNNSGILAYNRLLGVLQENVRTNFKQNQLNDLFKLATNDQQINITSDVLEGNGTLVDIPMWGLYGTSVQIIDETSLDSLKGKIDAIKIG